MSSAVYNTTQYPVCTNESVGRKEWGPTISFGLLASYQWISAHKWK